MSSPWRRHLWIPRSYTTVCCTADRNCRELYCLCKLLHRCDTVQATKQQAGPSGRESGVLEGVDKGGRRWQRGWWGLGVEPVIDISKVNEERDREGGGNRRWRSSWGAPGVGDRVIEVARKREARLAEGKGSEEEIDRREKEGANYRDRERNWCRGFVNHWQVLYTCKPETRADEG